MAKDRARKAGAADTGSAPPSKRQKALPGAQPKGLADVLLSNDAGSNQFKRAHTTAKERPQKSAVGGKNVKVLHNTTNGHGDVSTSARRKKKEEVVEISSDSSSDDDEDEEDTVAGADAGQRQLNGVNGVSHKSRKKAEEEEEEEDAIPADAMDEDDADAEPTFGERLEAQAEADVADQDDERVIDVEAILREEHGESSAEDKQVDKVKLVVTKATFKSTVVQALRTDDRQLFNACFGIADIDLVRDTITSLDSRFVLVMLKRLAERISATSARFGIVMVWVQWAIIAHGGYLASQPDAVQQMGALIEVLRERSLGLHSLLQLKGKLDMLSAQLDLRREQQRKSTIEREVFEYNEADEIAAREKQLRINGRQDESSDEDEVMEDSAFSKGGVAADEEESEESESDDDELVDDEAEETSNDEGDDESGSEEEEDEEDED